MNVFSLFWVVCFVWVYIYILTCNGFSLVTWKHKQWCIWHICSCLWRFQSIWQEDSWHSIIQCFRLLVSVDPTLHIYNIFQKEKVMIIQIYLIIRNKKSHNLCPNWRGSNNMFCVESDFTSPFRYWFLGC